jgi:hypothetical protein
MYTGNIIWQHSNFLRLTKFLTVEILRLTNHLNMNPSDVASTFVQLDHFLDTANNTLDTLSKIASAVHTPSTTTSSDYFTILEDVENQTLIKSTCCDIHYAPEVDIHLEAHDVTSVGLLINIIQASELIERTTKLLTNATLQHPPSSSKTYSEPCYMSYA